MADLQWGRVSSRQLYEAGASGARITRWSRSGYLRRVLPRVYGVGHVAESVEADLMAAIHYAGPGAALSHSTALWWHELLEHRPARIAVSTPHKCAPLAGVEVHARRRVEVVHRRRLPTTTVPQALLDFAATAAISSVVRALADLPKQGSKEPWKLRQNYAVDLRALRYGSLEDGAMTFSRRVPAAQKVPA